MLKRDYKQNAYYLMYLIRCALNDKVPAKEKLDKMNLSGVFAVAKAHSLTAIAAYALESAGIYDKAFEEGKNKAIRKEIIFDVERERVFAELEKAGIWYVPLKGIIMKDLYPQIGMRQMCDNDILFDKSKANEVRHIMEKLGFTTEVFDGDNHDTYHKPPVCNFEMHTALFLPQYGETINDYFEKIDGRIIQDSDSSHRYHFSMEDFYLYFLSHGHKHFNQGGIGLRFLVDVYVYNKEYGDKIRKQYIDYECKKLSIIDFENKIRELAFAVLNGNKLSQKARMLLDYMIFSGTYGTIQNSINNKLKNGNVSTLAKLNHIRKRIFVPVRKSDPQYKMYAARYKWFYKSKARIPLLIFYRIGIALTSRRNRVKAEVNAIIGA